MTPNNDDYAVSDTIRQDVWHRLYDAERLSRYYSEVLKKHLKSKNQRRRCVSIAAGTGLLVGFVSVFVELDWLGGVSMLIALLALYLAGSGQLPSLSEHCKVLEFVRSQCLYLKNETKHLWSRIEVGRVSDEDVLNQLRYLESLGQVVQAHISPYSFELDEESTARVEEIATNHLQQSYA